MQSDFNEYLEGTITDRYVEGPQIAANIQRLAKNRQLNLSDAQDLAASAYTAQWNIVASLSAGGEIVVSANDVYNGYQNGDRQQMTLGALGGFGSVGRAANALEEAADAAAAARRSQLSADQAGTIRTWDPSVKHGTTARGTAKGVSSPAPTNGQAALGNSVQVKPTSPRRVGVDPATGEIVVFDETTPGVFHGHVPGWENLHPDMQRALIKAGQVTQKGKIK